jgi:hypothetical protein
MRVNECFNLLLIMNAIESGYVHRLNNLTSHP